MITCFRLKFPVFHKESVPTTYRQTLKEPRQYDTRLHHHYKQSLRTEPNNLIYSPILPLRQDTVPQYPFSTLKEITLNVSHQKLWSSISMINIGHKFYSTRTWITFTVSKQFLDILVLSFNMDIPMVYRYLSIYLETNLSQS